MSEAETIQESLSEGEVSEFERYNIIKNGVIDPKTGQLIHPCPECGSECKQTTLGEAVASSGGELEEGDDPSAIAFRCSNFDLPVNPCIYMISIGELPT